jgi:hypothetical protein
MLGGIVRMQNTRQTFFYERTETASQTVYRFKKTGWPLYLACSAATLLFLTVFFHLLSPYVLLACTTAVLIYFIVSFVSHITPNAELRAAARRGALKVDGLVYTIDKTANAD